ncbi:unnamed protein product [Cylindrotheca closterium]|uniref:Uncharacterized protein n=1 Tax=Cylindrotheca closterium TaxID=2856 RepID=A0AAD2JP81_9STRA|nr:unnamed protein product [Cylindrotheca closterium]
MGDDEVETGHSRYCHHPTMSNTRMIVMEYDDEDEDPSPVKSTVSKGRPTNSPSSSDGTSPRAEAAALAGLQAATATMERGADQKQKPSFAEAHCSESGGPCDTDTDCCETLGCSQMGDNEVETGNNYCYCY